MLDKKYGKSKLALQQLKNKELQVLKSYINSQDVVIKQLIKDLMDIMHRVITNDSALWVYIKALEDNFNIQFTKLNPVLKPSTNK